ncbi:hypothetical protein IQ07DRAFT_591223 [Pyrenochaeta sp. DS3sAY3a]|nr:hypothetical protein IQ07DRAFT_591223 [Pyrenochaeta sp. DS3sAY3a]
MIFEKLFVTCMLPSLALGMQKRATLESFGLYGYGEGYGGFPLFYIDGYAYLGEAERANNSDAATVTFSSISNDEWTGSPNTTIPAMNDTLPSWSNVTFFVPGPAASDRRVGFVSSNETASSDLITSGFVFYGSTASLIGSEGNLETMFYALQVSERIHALYWNDTSLGQTPVVLRSIAPSNPPN